MKTVFRAINRGCSILCLMLIASSVHAQPFGYVINSDADMDRGHLLRVNLSNGGVTDIGNVPSSFSDIEGLAIDANGVLYAADNGTKSLIVINMENAETTLIGQRQRNLGFSPTVGLDFGMTFNCNNELLLVAEQTESLYGVDTSTGQAAVIGDSGGLGDSMTALASYGNQVFALSANNNGLYRINDEIGQATLVNTLEGVTINDAGMAFDADGQLWAILDGQNATTGEFNPSQILRINPLNGDYEIVAETRTGIESLAITPPTSCQILGPANIVPTLDIRGLALLVLLLSFVGLLRLKA